MYFDENDLQSLTKEEIIEKFIDLQNDYDNLDDDYGELEDKADDLQMEVDSLEAQIEDLKSGILDIDLFKEKLEFYGLYTEEMKKFLDLYLKLYNK